MSPEVRLMHRCRAESPKPRHLPAFKPLQVQGEGWAFPMRAPSGQGWLTSRMDHIISVRRSSICAFSQPLSQVSRMPPTGSRGWSKTTTGPKPGRATSRRQSISCQSKRIWCTKVGTKACVWRSRHRFPGKELRQVTGHARLDFLEVHGSACFSANEVTVTNATGHNEVEEVKIRVHVQYQSAW